MTAKFSDRRYPLSLSLRLDNCCIDVGKLDAGAKVHAGGHHRGQQPSQPRICQGNQSEINILKREFEGKNMTAWGKKKTEDWEKNVFRGKLTS